jgi:tetratricopeptide (TPR) repeat protein
MANIYRKTSNFESAIKYIKQSFEIHLNIFGDASKNLNICTNNIIRGKILSDMEQFDEAEKDFLQA